MVRVFARVFVETKATPRSGETSPTERGERLRYSLGALEGYSGKEGGDARRSRLPTVPVPDDALEEFIDFYASAYEAYVKLWSDGYSSVHYVRKKGIPSFVETWSPRSRTHVHVDISGLTEVISESRADAGSGPSPLGFTVHRQPFL